VIKMRNLSINLADVGGIPHEGDYVLLYAPRVRSSADASDGVVTTTPMKVTLSRGKATVQVEPGPLMVQLRCKGLRDMEPFEVIIPDGAGEARLVDVMTTQYRYTPRGIAPLEAIAERAQAAERTALIHAQTAERQMDVLVARTKDAIGSAGDLLRKEIKSDVDKAKGIREDALSAANSRRVAETAAASAAKSEQQSKNYAQVTEEWKRQTIEARAGMDQKVREAAAHEAAAAASAKSAQQAESNTLVSAQAAKTSEDAAKKSSDQASKSAESAHADAQRIVKSMADGIPQGGITYEHLDTGVITRISSLITQDIDALVDGAPEDLNTLKKLADAKAPKIHVHELSDITGLQSNLNSLSSSVNQISDNLRKLTDADYVFFDENRTGIMYVGSWAYVIVLAYTPGVKGKIPEKYAHFIQRDVVFPLFTPGKPSATGLFTLSTTGEISVDFVDPSVTFVQGTGVYYRKTHW
jgi:chemotaxis protein histidine kinase CheA